MPDALAHRAKVGLVFGGRSVEHKVSIRSARTVAEALAEAGYEVVPFAIAQDGRWTDPGVSERTLAGDLDVIVGGEGSIRRSLSVLLSGDLDVVFPVVHGTWGEDGTLQGLCEMIDLPYVGADVAASAICMDKLQCKRLLKSCGLPVVDWETVTAADLELDPEAAVERLERLSLPLFLKPSRGGSSVGVVRLERRDGVVDALRFSLRFDPVLVVESGVVGRELECSVLGDQRLEASAVGEVVPGNPFYDYQDKYLDDRAELHLPADLPAATAEEVRRLAIDAFAAVGGSGMARVDFLQDTGGDLYINEINTLPGFTSISMYPKLWEISGLPLPELVRRLVDIALERQARRSRLDRAIADWLAEIGS